MTLVALVGDLSAVVFGIAVVVAYFARPPLCWTAGHVAFVAAAVMQGYIVWTLP